MRIYLCGGGSGNQISQAFLDFANSIDKEKPILYIPLAMDKSKYNDCYKWFKAELKTVNLTNFEMIQSSEELSNKNLSKYSAIYIGGGNTFRLLSELKKYDILNNLRNYDGIIFGGSAGAIIFGKDINHCKLEEYNIIGLKDTTGLNYLQDYAILCHLNDKNLEKNKDYLEKYSRKNKLIYLPEEDVILLTGNEIIMFGEKDYIICKEGKIECHKPKDFKEKIIK